MIDLQTESDDFMISIEAIIGIAAGGITVVVVVTLVFVYCCYRYWKHHQKKVCTVPQTTIQIMYVQILYIDFVITYVHLHRPDGYVPHSRHSSVRASQIAHNLQASMILLRYAFKQKEKELPEIVTPV